MSIVVDWFIDQWQHNLIELLATICGFICIFLAAKENLWNWPFGILTVSLYFFVFFEAKLYADMGLQVIYLVLNFYGWMVWISRRGEKKVKPTEKITQKEVVILSFVGVIAWGVLYFILKRYTDAAIPSVDTLVTVICLIAQYLMSKKVLENWILWLVANAIYVPLFYFKGLYPSSILYSVLFINAIYGYWVWRRNYREENAV